MKEYEIKKIEAREVLDSRGKPTIEVDVYAGNHMGREMVPSGASKGTNEAVELRDGGDRYQGMGVEKAVANVKKIGEKLIGLDVRNQEEIDNLILEMDGTPNKSNLGANAIMGVSITCARTAALCEGKSFHQYFADLVGNDDLIIPTPFMNVINGGEHADNNLEFQEYHIVPCGETFKESLRMASEVYYDIKRLLRKKYGPFQVNVGDEGGFTPNMEEYYQPLDLLTEAIDNCGYNGKIKLALDAAASYFYRHGKYEFDNKRRDADEMLDIYMDMIDNYPIISIEDPFQEDDFESHAKLLARLPERDVNIVGDDLLCTNVERIKKALEHKSCNTLLLKVNQIGTVTEAIAAAKLAMENDWDVMVSHRSGETEDHFIADFAVGLSTGQIKAGAPCRGERTAKYNQLLRLEESIDARYTGKHCIRSCRFC